MCWERNCRRATLLLHQSTLSVMLVLILYCGLMTPWDSSSTLPPEHRAGKKCGKIFCETQLQLQCVVWYCLILPSWPIKGQVQPWVPRSNADRKTQLPDNSLSYSHQAKDKDGHMKHHETSRVQAASFVTVHPHLRKLIYATGDGVTPQQNAYVCFGHGLCSINSRTIMKWFHMVPHDGCKLDHWNSFTLHCQNLGSNIFTEKYLNKIREIESRPVSLKPWSSENRFFPRIDTTDDMAARFRHCNCTCINLYCLVTPIIWWSFRISRTRANKAIVLLMTLLFLFGVLSTEVQVQNRFATHVILRIYVCRKVILLGFVWMRKGLFVIRWSAIIAIKEGTQESMAHTISGQWLLNSLMSCSSWGSDRQDSKTAIFSSFLLLGRKWLTDARRYVWDLCSYIFHCYTIVTLYCPPKLPYAVTHPSNFAHLFPEPATYSQLSNNTVSLLVLQALLHMEDVSRLSRFGTQVNDPRDLFFWGQGQLNTSLRNAWFEVRNNFLLARSKGDSDNRNQESLERRKGVFFFSPFRHQLRWSTTSLLRWIEPQARKPSRMVHPQGSSSLRCWQKFFTQFFKLAITALLHWRDMKKYESNIK